VKLKWEFPYKPAGGLPVGAEDDRNIEVDDDGKNGSRDGVGSAYFPRKTLDRQQTTGYKKNLAFGNKPKGGLYGQKTRTPHLMRINLIIIMSLL